MWSDVVLFVSFFLPHAIPHFHTARSGVYLPVLSTRYMGRRNYPPKKSQMPVRFRASLLPTSQKNLNANPPLFVLSEALP